MTTLYKPVLIESAEQAAEMPVGTLAILDDDTLPVALHVTKTAEHLMPWRNGKHAGPDENVVGAQALVPIEAEEETVRDISPEVGAYGPDDEIPEQYLGPPRTRYATPWEEA